MKNTKDMYNNLVDSVINMLVVYYPDYLIDEKILDSFDDELKAQVFNKFLAVSNNDVVEKSMIELHKFQCDKTSTLENNALILLDSYKKLSQVEFHVLVTKYIDFVEFLASGSKWLCDHLKDFTDREIDPDWNALLFNQANQLKNHFVELFNIFSEKIHYKAKEYYTNEEFLQKYLPNFLSRYTGFIEKYNLTDYTDLPVDYENDNQEMDFASEEKQTMILNEKDAELYLLESVFNVNVAL